MSSDAKGVFAFLGMLAALAAVFAGWLMIINLAPTFGLGAFWSAVYLLGLSFLFFTLAGQGNPLAGYRWFVSKD